MKPIAIFFHCLFYMGDEFRPRALEIVQHQMNLLKSSGLADAASEIVIGINGGDESRNVASIVCPAKARFVMHGLQSHAENLTIVELERWAPAHPDWYVLYFHAKGCTHRPGESYGDNVSGPWREGMMIDLIDNWRQCVADLDSGFESVGSHFMREQGWDHSQFIWAGNFFWVKSSFVCTLPSIYRRERIKMSGIASAESRYEAEVWIGNGPRLPMVKEYRPGGDKIVP